VRHPSSNARQPAYTPEVEKQIETELRRCVDEARFEVLERHMPNRRPTPKECNEQVGTDGRGQPITRAMQMGLEMHQSAFDCVGKALSVLRPGGFSLEPRYRYDLQTKTTTLVTAAEEKRLLAQGLARELIGTLVPDVVIHNGDPLTPSVVYDFKFPCVNSDQYPTWRDYPDNHPYAGRDQGEMYREALKEVILKFVVPILGVLDG